MFDLKKAIANWKQELRRSPAFEDGDIAELESHLRDEVERLWAKGLSLEEAFHHASEKIGDSDTLGIELFRSRAGQKTGPVPPWKQKSWLPSLLPNYLKVTARNIRRQAGYVTLNTLGLGVGMACCILILLFINDELNYDTFIGDSDRIYRVTAVRGDGDNVSGSANTSYPIGPALKNDYPEIEQMTRFRRMFKPVISAGENNYREDYFYVADSTFLEVFDFPLAAGSAGDILAAPGNIILTAETARRYFGSDDPMGKNMTYRSGFGGVLEFTVAGVLEDLPENTHMRFDFIAPIHAFAGPFERWKVFVQNYTYLKLAEESGRSQLASKLPDFVNRHVGPQLDEGEIFALHLQSLPSIHLHSDLQNEQAQNGNIVYIWLFSGIGLLILLIACINFMNMSTARSAERAREVGMRKVLGGTRSDLIRQFMMESLLMSVMALMFAVALIWLFLPEFNRLTGKTLGMELLLSSPTMFYLATITLGTGLVAGSYPALMLSSFKPVQVLKSRTSSGSSGYRLRRALVIFQFAVTVTLLVGTTVIYRQLNYTENKDMGFEREQVVVIPIDTPTGNRSGSIKEELKRHPEILNASVSMLIPSEQMWTYSARRVDQSADITIGFCKVDFSFFETYGIDMVAGRAFSESIAADSGSTFVINEQAAAELGFDAAESAIGEDLVYGGSRRGSVVGVVKDFHNSSLHTRIGPAIFFVDPEYYYLSVRLSGENTSASLEVIESTLASFSPSLPFEYSFLDSRLDQLYAADENTGEVIASFSLLAVILSCFGLFGLTAYSAQQRAREIGVRKVMGATTANVFILMAGDYLKLVAAGFIAALPIAYMGATYWLRNFEYHITVGPDIYLFSGAAIMIIALLTVSWQSVRAALLDPVKSLGS